MKTNLSLCRGSSASLLWEVASVKGFPVGRSESQALIQESSLLIRHCELAQFLVRAKDHARHLVDEEAAVEYILLKEGVHQ